MATSDVITIGKDRFILDPTGDGRYAQASDLAEQLAAHSPLTEEALPGYIPTYSTNWRLEQQQRVGSGYCLMPGCPKETKRKFCGYRHERAYQARRYRRRQQGMERWIEVVNGQPVRFERKIAASVQLAKQLFSEHIAPSVCQFKTSSGDCPGSQNTYSDPSKLRCLIYATLADDLMLLSAQHRGFVVDRRYTSSDGAWKDTLWTPPNSS